MAVKWSKVNIVKVLIKAGADTDIQNVVCWFFHTYTIICVYMCVGYDHRMSIKNHIVIGRTLRT